MTRDERSARVGQDIRTVERLLQPQSIAIIGISSNPGSVGRSVLSNLRYFNYKGDIFLVSRSLDEVDGIKCYPTIDDLPSSIDVAVLCVPVSAAIDTVQACARRQVRAVVAFGAGYAEAGESGRAVQEAVVDIARSNGMLVLGPNCMGLTNFVHSMPLTFAPGLKKTVVEDQPAVALLTQSGGMMSNIREICQARGLAISYAISTGNEAVVGVEDFLDYLVQDQQTKVITMYVEQIRRPQVFLRLAEQARRMGKVIVLLHPGRSESSREAAKTHTGSLVGDVAVIQTLVENAGVLMVETIDELVDVSWLLAWFQASPKKGAAILTDSGALKGFSLDFCESVNLQLAALSLETHQSLDQILPAYTTASNPLDITAQALTEPEIYTNTAELLLDDPGVDALVVAVLPGSPAVGLKKALAIFSALESSQKPVVFVVVGEGAPLATELHHELRQRRIPLFRSLERTLRALADVMRFGARADRPSTVQVQVDIRPIDLPRIGVLPEFEGKTYAAQMGIPVLPGKLCKDVDQAVEAAQSIGYSVVLKAQSQALTHKSDIGGVIIGIESESQLRTAWKTIHSNIEGVCPDVTLDGLLLEAMSPPGVEVVVGAKRDEKWGPVVMVGLGGIWIEALKDVRLLPPNLPEQYIVEELLQLRASSLLRGARGAEPADVEALAKIVSCIGREMSRNPRLQEIDINPVMVYSAGKGAMALDVLVVTT